MREAFLQFGSDVDGCDDAVRDLIKLANLDEAAFNEIADLVSASLSKARKENGIVMCFCGENEATINGAWCSNCFPDTGR